MPPGDVARGAVVLAQTVGDLPTGVHLAVVDPGVGTARRPVALRTPGGLLVGPDNGLLIWAAEALGGVTEAVELTQPRRGTRRRSPAPSTAATSSRRSPRGWPAAPPLADAGPAVDPADLVRLPEPRVSQGDGWLEATVLSVDRFGNIQLAADSTAGAGRPPGPGRGASPRWSARRSPTRRPGGLVLLVDSAGRWRSRPTARPPTRPSACRPATWCGSRSTTDSGAAPVRGAAP